MILALVQNVALLVTLIVVLLMLYRRLKPGSLAYVFAAGILFGAVAMAGMATPVHFAAGVIYDGRSIVLGLAGLFGGPVTAVVAALMSGAYRLYLGGAGTLPGLLVIGEAAAFGVILHFLRRRDERWVGLIRLWAFGVMIHVVMLALQLALPASMGWEVLRSVGPPVLILFPLGFVLMAEFLLDGERRQMVQESLGESERMYQTLFERASVGIFLIGGEGEALAVNPAMARILHDKSPSDLVAANDGLLSGLWADPAVRSRDLEELWATGVLKYLERKGRTRDGREIWLRMNLTVVKQEGSERDIIQGFALDISERERGRLTTAVEQVAEMVVITDLHGAIEYVNPAFEAVTGYGREEVLGRDPSLLNSAEQDQSAVEEARKAISTGRIWRGRFLRQKKDGTPYVEDLSVSPVHDEDGGIVNFVGVSRDVTQEIQLEEHQRQALKMEAVGRLAGGVAHDFNNMLSVILGHVEIVMEDSRLAGQAERRADLEEIQRAAERSARLTRQLLTFSRRQIIDPVVLDLNESISGMLTMLRQLIGEQIEIVWVPGSDLWATEIDPAQVDQVLTNLVTNARDSIHGVGRVTIETKNATISQAYSDQHEEVERGTYVMLAVSDDGGGMDQDTLDHIFEPFFTTKPGGSGTGFGMATVHGIVGQNEGFIQVQSEPEKGTTVKVYLRRHAGEAQSLKGPTPAAEHKRAREETGEETVLLVEDEEALRNLGRRILEQLGYKVLTASTPSEALRIAGERCPAGIQLLVTDVILPEMNGVDLQAQLQPQCPDLKTLFMSGYSEDIIAEQGVLAKNVNFIEKPFSIDQFASRVRKILDG